MSAPAMSSRVSDGYYPRNDLPFPVYVTDHARERARERFPGFKAARIIDEVRAAFREGRFSGYAPPGFVSHKDEGYGFFAWTRTASASTRCVPATATSPS